MASFRSHQGAGAVCLIVVVLALCTTAGAVRFAGGTGEPNDPYQIATAADLIALGETPADYDKHFILTADIDLDPNLPGRKVFDRAVIGTLTGIFDGNGHGISHLTIKGGGYLGLFGELRTGAEVKNLGVADVNITASDDYSGGFVGINGGALTACYSTGLVIGREDVGGLVGDNWGTVAQCYSVCAVTGGYGVGGLMAENSGGTVSNCYSAGLVRGPGRNSGLMAYNRGTVIRCFWDIQTSGQLTSAGGTGNTTAEMQMAKTFLEAGWDFVGETANGSENIWKIAEGLGYPRLSWEKYSGGTGEPNDPYQITTAADLIALGETPEDYDKHFVLTADIDLDPNLPRGKVFDKAVIGFFAGHFEGNDHTISHLTILGSDFLGLFGQLGLRDQGGPFAEVRNLRVDNVNITGSGSYIGALVGENNWAILTRSYSSGKVTGHDYVGGLAGYNWQTMTDCHSATTVVGASQVGGLVGGSWATLNMCRGTGTVVGNSQVGGLVGFHRGTVSRCYSTGEVSGDYAVGGLIGYSGSEGARPHAGSIDRSYSLGNVRGEDCVGGLVGRHQRGAVRQCYSAGAVSGSAEVGGLVGGGWSSDVNECLWDVETSGLAVSHSGQGKTTAQMQTASTFLDAGWDFVGEMANGTEDIWWILEGKDYPRLWWQKYSGGRGTADEPYRIATAADLIALGERPEDYDKHFVLTADIDLDPNLPGRKVFDRALIAPDVNDLQYSFQGTAFAGAFDGAGHAIRHLTIADPNHDCLGLFGMIAAGGRVSNLALEDAEISGGYHSINVGTLAGYNAGTLADCSATGIAIGCGNVRELAGYNIGSITDCHADVRVSWLCE